MEGNLFTTLVQNTEAILGMVTTVAETVFQVQIVQIFLGITLVSVAISLLGRMVKKFKK